MNRTMKQLMLTAIILVAASVVSFGQQSENSLPTYVSKDVHRVQLASAALIPAVLVTGETFHASKAIARLNQPTGAKQTAIVTTGIPAHAIQKGVARMQYQKNN